MPRCLGVLTELSPKDAKINVGIPENTGIGFSAELGLEIKKNPNNRQIIREHLRPRTTSFLEAVNEIIRLAEAKFIDQGYRGLLVIVDNLDRVFRNPIPGTNRNTHDALFVDAGEHLSGLDCDMIYTLPPAALYSLTVGRLSTIFGTQPQMLPMIPVSRRLGGEDEQGIAKLIETIDRRLKAAATTGGQAFDSDETIKRLCLASGGYMRSLMTLMQAASNYMDALPITRDAVEQAIRDARDGFIRSIRTPQQWQSLRDVATTGQITETEDYLELLENYALLEYRDDEGPWYDVNPVIKEARQFKV